MNIFLHYKTRICGTQKMAMLEPVWVSIFHHSISVTQFPLLITHFFTLIWQHHFYFHHSIFSYYSWVPHLSVGIVFFIYFIFSTQLTEANIKNKKLTSQPRKRKRKRKRKKKEQCNPKKKSQKVVKSYGCGSSMYV